MNVEARNQLFLQGKTDTEGLFPQLDELKKQTLKFNFDFGLKELPQEPGLLLIRGARQMGKSTWLEEKLYKTLSDFGKASAFYLNGDFLSSVDHLANEVSDLVRLFPKNNPIKRIFIDEITAISDWENAIKRLYDMGITRDILIITTGSKAIDLRRGAERLPGRKGKLDRTTYHFTHIPYIEFERVARKIFKENTLYAYLFTGGSPLAANALCNQGKLPEYVITLTKDWIFGECAAQGRSRNLLHWLTQALLTKGCTPVSLTKLAREASAANNTTLQGYIELLCDLLCMSTTYQIDPHTHHPIPRKEHKYHWIHLLAALSFLPNQMRDLESFKAQSREEMSVWWEWAVAQELWRRKVTAGEEMPETLFFWKNHEHELDFFKTKNHWIEVKLGRVKFSEFQWFAKSFPKDELTLINTEEFQEGAIQGVTLENFLRNKG